MLTLDDICTLITDGSHFSPEDEGTGYPMLSVKDMCDDYFDITNCKYVGEEAYQKLVSNGCRPQVNDVVVAKDGSFLKTAFTVKEDLDIVLLSSIAILRPKLDMIVPEYLSYYLKSPCVYRTVSLNYISGTALKRIILKGLRKIPIEVPKLEEQYQRVKLLNSLKRVIKQRKTEMQKLDDLIKARFVEMFGTPSKNEKDFPMLTVDDVIEFTGGAQPDKKYFEYEPAEDNIRLIQIRDYKTDNYITYIPKSMAKRFCDADDIMIGRYGPPIFQILKGIEGSYNVALMKATPKMGNKEFIRYFLKQECLFNYLDGLSQRTAGQSGIEMSALKAYPFPYPPIELQEQFEQFANQVDKSKVAVQKALDETQLLLESLMQKYFG